MSEARKLSAVRLAVLQDVEASGGSQSRWIARRLSISTTTVSGALQWLRMASLVEFIGYWHATDNGRAALSQRGAP